VEEQGEGLGLLLEALADTYQRTHTNCVVESIVHWYIVVVSLQAGSHIEGVQAGSHAGAGSHTEVEWVGSHVESEWVGFHSGVG